MTATLSDAQRKAISKNGGLPLHIEDEQTKAMYVLLSAEQYEKVRALFEPDEFDPSEMYAAMDEVARQAGWDDPEMDIYNDLDPRRQPNQ